MSDLENRVVDNLQTELFARLQRVKRVNTTAQLLQWQQDKEKLLSLCRRKKSLLEERNEYVPLPANLERKLEVQNQKKDNRDQRKVDIWQKRMQQEKDKKETKLKKAKDKETEQKVLEQKKKVQQQSKREKKEQLKSEKEKRRLEQKQDQMEKEKIEQEKAKPINSPSSTQLECCPDAAQMLINDHLVCLFRLKINP